MTEPELITIVAAILMPPSDTVRRSTADWREAHKTAVRLAMMLRQEAIVACRQKEWLDGSEQVSYVAMMPPRN